MIMLAIEVPVRRRSSTCFTVEKLEFPQHLSPPDPKSFADLLSKEMPTSVLLCPTPLQGYRRRPAETTAVMIP
jgi:hypothetical protein